MKTLIWLPFQLAIGLQEAELKIHGQRSSFFSWAAGELKIRSEFPAFRDLPVSQGSKNAAVLFHPGEGSSRKGGKVKDRKDVEILLIEDDPNHAELTLIALREGNLQGQIHLAKDGDEALHFLFSGDLRDQQLKLILLDLKLNKMDGLELLRKIRSDTRTQYIPVVVLTSSQNERDIMTSYRYGANSYIVKPLEYEKFVRVVSQLGIYWVQLNQPPMIDREQSEGTAGRDNEDG
jgi:two-component system, response regulator